MRDPLDQLVRTWTSLGIAFGVEPADDREIDLERLLLETARRLPGMARLYVMPATWLHHFADTVAKHRLIRLIDDALDVADQPALGLLLDTAQQRLHPKPFDSVLKHLLEASPPRPLFEGSRANASLRAIAHDRASEISKSWGRWAQPIELKPDALRPASWVMARHPELRTQADFRGDLRASVLAALRHDPGARESEVRLAELAGGSRSQVRNALANLRLTGRVSEQWTRGRRMRRCA